MDIDFFIKQCQTENITAERFGICDRSEENTSELQSLSTIS